MDRWHYLLVLVACLVLTAPLEWLGAHVYRRPRRTARAILPVAAVFLLWDVLATANGVWSFNPQYVLGVDVPAGLPIEEALFFVVIPLCALLTYGCLDSMLRRPARSQPGRDTR